MALKIRAIVQHVSPLRIDAARLCILTSLFLITSLAAAWIGAPSVPWIPIELVVLSPALHTGWGVTLVCVSLLTSMVRCLQAVFGFDQIFVSAYMLANNLAGFTWSATVASIGIPLACTGLLIRILLSAPKYYVPLPTLLLPATLSLMGSALILEDHTRQNLVGTSYGYLFGQVRFAGLFHGAYQVPLKQPEPSISSREASKAIANRENFLLIIVESWGKPQDPDQALMMSQPFRSESLRQRYDVHVGERIAQGSTIHGEIRELCDGHLVNGLFGTQNPHCLPRQFQAAGYHSTAVHANKAGMYGRDIWYPAMGFNRYENSDTRNMPEVSLPGRWGTLLDTETVKWAISELFKAPKEFVYLLTVSTHLPPTLLPGATISPTCQQEGAHNACTHVANIDHVLKAIVNMTDQLPPQTRVVIVGDHPPPFLSPQSRRFFARDRVPYVVLAPRQSSTTQ